MERQIEEVNLQDGTRLSMYRGVSVTLSDGERVTGDWLIAIEPSGRRNVVLIFHHEGKKTAKTIYDTETLKRVDGKPELLPNRKLEYVLHNIDDLNEENRFFAYREHFKPYGSTFNGMDPVAVKLNQTTIHAPEQTDWGKHKCSCGEAFSLGGHRRYPTNNEGFYITKFERILQADHEAKRPHENLYDLLAYPI